MIKKVTPQDMDSAFLLFKNAIKNMNEMNIFQWSSSYPNNEIIGKDIRNGHAFGYYMGSELCGSIVLNEDAPKEYVNIKWGIESTNPLIIHRLAVLPEFQGKGIAKNLIKYAEEYAVVNKYITIRVETFSLNPIAINLYESLGYKRKGNVNFDRGVFHCFEKIF